MIEHIHGNLYKLQIQLPRNPLKWLNSYVILSHPRNLIIDTGFDQPECLEALLGGIRELGVDMSKTDVLATHLHADHSGLISKIISANSKVYMGRIDGAILMESIYNFDKYWALKENRFHQEGYPEKEMTETGFSNPSRNFASKKMFEINSLDDGNTISYGGFDWHVILTPGHTPGHICLYEQQQKILITGDHLLFDITPNITWWKESVDSLGDYLASLNKISHLEVKMTLTAHRENKGIFHERIKELFEHHKNRLNEVLEIVRKNEHISAYDIAAKMKWSIQADSWADFPPAQRWFAVGEAIAHINYLVLAEKLQVHNRHNINTYTLRYPLDYLTTEALKKKLAKKDL